MFRCGRPRPSASSGTRGRCRTRSCTSRTSCSALPHRLPVVVTSLSPTTETKYHVGGLMLQAAFVCRFRFCPRRSTAASVCTMGTGVGRCPHSFLPYQSWRHCICQRRPRQTRTGVRRGEGQSGKPVSLSVSTRTEMAEICDSKPKSAIRRRGTRNIPDLGGTVGSGACPPSRQDYKSTCADKSKRQRRGHTTHLGPPPRCR